MTRTVFFRGVRFGSKRLWGGWKCVLDDFDGRTDAFIFRNYRSGRIFCPVHRRWERFRNGIEPYSFVCQFGRGFSGLTVPYVAPLLSGLRDSNDEYVQECLKDKDHEGIPYGIFRYVVETDFWQCECRLVIDRVDFDHHVVADNSYYSLPGVYSNVYHYKFGQGRIATTIGHQVDVDERYPSVPKIPLVVSRYVEDTARTLATVFAGKQITVNRRYYRGLPLLEALSHCPYEANMHHVIAADEWGTQNWLNPARSDVYNEWCRHYHLKSFPRLRKEFELRPQALNNFLRLRNWGFRDVNVMMAGIKKYPIEELSVYQTKFFVDLSLKKRGEKATLHALFKDAAMSQASRNDTARMFHGYYYDLAPEEREQILRDGFTQYNHDLLAKVSGKIGKGNHFFQYTFEQLGLEDGEDDAAPEEYAFRLPKGSEQLWEIGAALHNCVGTYVNKVFARRCTIVYAKHQGKYALCIEVVNGKIEQAVVDRDRTPDGDAKVALCRWALKHNLAYKYMDYSLLQPQRPRRPGSF